MSDPDARWGLDDEDYWTPESEPAAPVESAIPELLALAAKARGGKWRDRLEPAITAAQTAGWDWPRIGKAASLLIFDPDGEPRALTDATRDPVRRQGPGDYASGAAAAREALERARAGL